MLSGGAGAYAAIARLNADGTVDTTWSASGMLEMSFATAEQQSFTDLALVGNSYVAVGAGAHRYGTIARFVP